MSFQSVFRAPLQASTLYVAWRADNPREASRFETCMDRVLAGTPQTVPAMASNFGRFLVGAVGPWVTALAPVTPPAPAVSSVFAGRGCLTAHDPLVLIREGLVGCFDWIAVKGDGGDRALASDADALRAAGAKQIHVWYACDGSPINTAFLYRAEGVICQAEGQSQLDEAARIGFGLTKRALVTNNFMGVFPEGWDVLAESYWNVVAASSPGSVVSDSLNRGARTAFPCFGVGTWGEAYRTVPLSYYVAEWAPTNWSVYLGEYLTPADVEWLKAHP